jgi:hypothetical protein
MFTITLPYLAFDIALDLCADHSVSAFLAATIRGGLGYTLRGLVCAEKERQCRTCLLREQCVYCYLFETLPSINAPRMQNYHAVPRPFTIVPHQNGTSVSIHLTLIGRASSYLAYFIYALNRLGEKGLGKNYIRFSISNVTESGTGRHVYPCDDNGVDLPQSNTEVVVQPGDPQHGNVTLAFATPLVVRIDNSVLDHFDPRAFISTLLRRITNLAAFHNSNENPAIDPQSLIDAAIGLTIKQNSMQPIQQSRFSTRQHQRLDYSGIIGSVELSGDIGTLLPLLRAGEILGVGKNCVFGYGRYEMN